MEHVQDELVLLEKGIILKLTKVVIPVTLQEHATQLANEGHQGIIKTKQLMQEKVWFVGIDKTVERIVSQCLLCQVATPVNKRELLKLSKLLDRPWSELSIDLTEIPTSDYLLVITDDHSKFPIVETITSTSARAVIPKLDQIFSEYGIPDTLRSDNGPPFNSHEFTSSSSSSSCVCHPLYFQLS